MSNSTPTKIASLSRQVGPLSAALFGGYVTGTLMVVLLWHLI